MGNLCSVKNNTIDDTTIEVIDKPNNTSDETSEAIAYYKDGINLVNNIDIIDEVTDDSNISSIPSPFDRKLQYELIVNTTRTIQNQLSHDSVCDIINSNTKSYILELLYYRMMYHGKYPLTDNCVQYVGNNKYSSLPCGVKLYQPKVTFTINHPPRIYGIPVMPLFEKDTFYLYFVDANSIVYETLVAYSHAESVKSLGHYLDYGAPTYNGKILTISKMYNVINNELRIRSIGKAIPI